MKNARRNLRIVVTGGPGGGKTTAADLFRRELGEKVVIVPEAATMLFSGGFPRSQDFEAQKSTQLAIYHTQQNLEDVHSHIYKDRILLCDRGTLDGLAYWPNSNDSFFDLTESNLEKEMARYDGVVFFESAAVGGISIEGGNAVRNESLEQAVNLDKKLRAVWTQHSHFIQIPHNPSFIKKINQGLEAIETMIKRVS